MYEEKTKRKFNINWKSLIIKMIILLVAIFIIIWLIALVNKDKKVKPSNLSTNLQVMKDAAFEYFTDSKLPLNINGKKKITLQDMFDSKLLVEFKDQNNNSCDTTNSYAEATKINDSDFTIKVKLVCGKESDYVINTITKEINLEDKEEDNKKEDSENVDNTNKNENSSINSDKNNNSSSNSSSTNNSSSNKNNVTNNSNKNNTTTNTNKPNNNSSNITHVTTNKNNNSNSTNNSVTCKYGDTSYVSNYPLVYVIPDKCAVSKDVLYQAKHANTASSIGAKEYKNLVNEIDELKNKTGAHVYVETPVYTEIMNKNNTGYVGFQVMFVVKYKYGYTTKVIYQYYLDKNGDRKVVIDNRSSVKVENEESKNNNTNNLVSNIKVTNVEINKKDLTLYEAEIYDLDVKITPSNATNKDVIWSSSDKLVATVDKNGKVTALKEGVTYITASVGKISDKIKVTVIAEETYKYCKKVEEDHYSISYARSYTKDNHWTIKLDKENVLDVMVINASHMFSELYRVAYLYSQDKGISKVGNNNGISIPSNYILEKHSLKPENFNFSISQAYKYKDSWYIDARVEIDNLNNVEPYYDINVGNIYFVPFYFRIRYIDLNNCVEVKASEVDKYKDGYERIDN